MENEVNASDQTVFSENTQKKEETNKNEYLKDCPKENVFWVCNGSIIRNLYELADSIEHMNEETFRYHVDKKNKKNDFAIWVKNIIGDKVLAKRLQKIQKRKKYLRIIKERIHELEFDIKTPIKKEDKLIILLSIISLLVVLFTSFFNPNLSSKIAIVVILLFIVYKIFKS